MKRLIRRHQVIDCGATTCGRCTQRESHVCKFWFVELGTAKLRGRTLYLRCYSCVNGEVASPREHGTVKT